MIGTQKNETLIDWFQVTIFPKKSYNEGYKILYSDIPSRDKIVPIIFKELFDISSSDIFREPTGLNGYDIRYSYKDINIMIHSFREEMGINILLRGSGCRDFEDLGITWPVLFSKLVNFDINFNRIDIAIDTFTNKYFNIELLNKYIRNGLCVSKFKRALNLQERILKNGIIGSNTLQFGSKASDIEITFYDKYLERTNAGYIINKNIDFWVRTELRFRHDHAKTIFELINNNSDYSTFIKQVLYNYIDFKEPNSKDSNISRRKSVQWWSRFVDTEDKLVLTSRSSERKISHIYNWLLSSTSRSQLMVYMSKLPNLKLDMVSVELLYKYLTTGVEKLKDKDLFVINDYRKSNNLIPFTKEELNCYVTDLKNSYLDD